MGILSGIISYAFGLALNLLDAAVNGFLGALGFDLDAFEHYFPAAADFYDVIIGFSIGLLLMMLIFQLFRNFGIVLDMEAEDPLKMLGKTALFFGMILSSRSIINLILQLMADPYAIFLNTASDPYEFELITLVTAMFDSIFASPFFSIVAMIMMLVLGWQFLKLTVECVERYIVFYFVLYCAPVVFSTGAFKSTAQIFKSWCRMVGSQALLLLINIWSIKLFLSFMPVFESGADDMIFNFILGYAFLKFAQKADTLLRILGLNTASTGDMMGSLTSSVAGVAMAIRPIGGAAKGVISAVGERLGNAHGGNPASDGGAGSDPDGGDEIGGMRFPKTPPPSAGGGTGAQEPVGITAAGISTAKQGYIADVLRAARMQGNGNADIDVSNEESQKGQAVGEASHRDEDLAASRGNIPMQEQEGGSSEKPPDLSSIDEETSEGLSNLAHGIPHDHYDPETRKFSGGGFPEFTGKDANLIGPMQLSPAEGYQRSSIRLPDGGVGTVYRNAETGDAQIVQLASVDNGVMQGTIRRLDPETGKMGEDFAFQAVHSSVPGAESVSIHAVPVKEPSGGAYYVATGADTSFLARSSGETAMVSGTSYTPGGTSKMQQPQKPVSGAGTVEVFHNAIGSAAVSSDIAGSSEFSSVDTPTVSPPSGSEPSMGVISSSESSWQQPPTPQGAAATGPVSSQATAEGPAFAQSVASAETLPVSTGMGTPQNQVRRFSKHNPANLEVFRRESGAIETFEKNADEGPIRVSPPQKPNRKDDQT